MSAERLLTIGEVAGKAGLAPSALRYYEDVGLIRPAIRQSGRRRYPRSILRRLAVIDLLKAAGFPLEDIRGLLAGGRTGWRTRTRGRLREMEERIARAQAARSIVQAALTCGCDRLEGCDMAVRAGAALQHRRT